MSYVQERIDIESRLATGWVVTPIAWDNVPFVPTLGTAWIRCAIFLGGVEALEFGRGDALKEFDGIIDIGIFVPRGTGTALVRGYMDTLTTLFSMVAFGSIDCDEASVQNLGEEEDWHHTVITIPFSRRE